VSPATTLQVPDEYVPAAPRLRLPLDLLITLAVVGLGVCSLVTLHSATRADVPGQPNYYVERQGIYLALGLVAMLALSRIDYSKLREFKYGLFAVLILGIIAVLGAGHAANGAQRAINFPFFSFQASEVGKVLLILVLSAYVVDRSRHIGERDTTARVMLLALIPAMLVIAQPDLGSGMVYVAIAMMVLFVAGTSWRSGSWRSRSCSSPHRRRGFTCYTPTRCSVSRLSSILPITPTARVISRTSRRSRSDPVRSPDVAPSTHPSNNLATSPNRTPTSYLPPSASGTASSALRSCFPSTRC
jgi:Cell cycle protein